MAGMSSNQPSLNPVEALINDYALRSYPYDVLAPLESIEVVLDNLCHDPKIAYHFFRQAGLIDANGNWHPTLVAHGLIIPIEMLEADSASAYCEKIRPVYVSDRGKKFIEAFFAEMF